MSAPSVRRPIHRGSVLAAGLFVDTRVLGEDAARERLLRSMGAGARVVRSGSLLVASLRAPSRLTTTESPAGLLVRYGDVLSSAPLESDELAVLNTAGPAAVIVLGGEPVVVPLDGAPAEDAASWIDVSDFEVASGVKPLGRERKVPVAVLAPKEVDVRGSLGVAAAPPEASEVRRALLQGNTASGEGGRPAGPGPAGAGVWASLAARFFAGLGTILSYLIPSLGAGASGAGWGEGTAAPAATVQGRPAGRTWLSRFSRKLHMLALQALVWSRLVRVVGRRQAEYLSRMLDMFERGDLDAALRHAIALGGETEGEPAPPGLGTPTPREDLAIVPRRRGGGITMYSGPVLFEELRRRYRRAFEQLERAGEVEKAAFVLAELLGANEEAVGFLEKHGRLRLAAEIAEARGLPAGLVVRQWFLAGDARRAVRLARATGAFADAVHRLETSGRKKEAAALRLAWADALAQAGSYVAAVDAVWPVEPARELAARWLDLAIEAGGPTGAQMVARKARLFPGSLPEMRDRVLGLLREPGEEGAAVARGLAQEIGSFGEHPSSRALAKPVVRALLRMTVAPDGESERRALADTMLKTARDPLLSEEVRMLFRKVASGRRAGVSVEAAATTREHGPHGPNEDAFLAALLSVEDAADGARPIRGDAGKVGIALGVFDGMGGMAAGGIASGLAAETVTANLRRTFPRSESLPASALSLRAAVSAAGWAIHRRAMTDGRARGCGSTAVVATVFGDTLIVAHVGDSRAYLLRGGRLTALTRDHRLLNELGSLRLVDEVLKGFSQGERAEVYRKIITRALGLAESVQVDVATVRLCDGDVVLLCTDGVWEALPEDRLASLLSSGEPPEELCAALDQACGVGAAQDDRTAVIARVSGKALPPPKDGPAEVQPFDAAGAAVLLRENEERLVIRRAPGTAGALPISDVAELPDGRLLAALGELGAWLLSRDGRPLTRFAEPAQDIVMSDGGDRALLLARRGEITRVARLDLARRRRQPWCDARVTACAPGFDGSIWYVAQGDTLYAIDATQAGWEHLWQVSEPGARILAVAREPTSLAALFELEHRGYEVWTWHLPSHRLLGRSRLDGVGRVLAASLSPRGELAALELAGDGGGSSLYVLRKQGAEVIGVAGEPGEPRRSALSEEWLVTPGGERGGALDVFDTGAARLRLRVALEGSRPTGRICGDHLLVFDDRGRLLVISLATGAVIREARLT